MENPEEILQSLDEFVKLKPKDIPKELEDYLSYVAKTGDPVYQWSLVKCLFREKLVNVITEFYEGCPTIELPPCPNVDSFNYEIMKNSLLERLESFGSAPFTVQRLCELLTSPKKQYSRADKFMRAVEKNILVVSTREPGNVRRSDSNQTELVNGVADGPPVELVETIETVAVEGMNLMHGAAGPMRLSVETTAVASTTRLSNVVEAKCSHSVDPGETGQKIVPGWMNDPSLTDTSRPSVSERVAMIEKADTSSNLEGSGKLTAEFHTRFSQPITEPGLLEEEDEEDLIPSSQEDNQYFPTQKLKPDAVEIVNVTDFVNLPSPDSSETSAAVSAISEDSSNSLIEAASLDSVPEATVISSDSSLDAAAEIDSATEPTPSVDTPSSDANLDSSLEPTSESDNLPVIAEVSTTDVSEPSSPIKSPSAAHEKAEEPNAAEEAPEIPVEIPQEIADLLPSAEPVQSFVTEPSDLPTAETKKSIPEESPVEDSEPPVPSPPVEISILPEALDSVQEPEATTNEPDVAAEPETPKLTSEEERDREMMVQNERIESVIQGTGDQDVEQTFFREAPMESLPLEAAPLLNVPVEQPLEVPMEDKPLEVEPEAMEVDETSQTDEPMDQEDLSPKQS